MPLGAFIYFAHVRCQLFASTLHALVLSGYIRFGLRVYISSKFISWTFPGGDRKFSRGISLAKPDRSAQARGSGLKPIAYNYPVLYHRNTTLYVNCITLNEYNYVYVIKMFNDTILCSRGTGMCI